MKKSIGTILLSFILTLSFSQVVRKYSDEFLNIGVGARGLSMSNAQAASVSDIYATYYNPAGLINIQQTFQIGIMHSEYFAGIAKYDYAAVAIPVVPSKSVIAFSFVRFGVDDIPNTLFLVGPDGSINYNNITSFSEADYAFQMHYAQALPIAGLSIGGSAKIIYRQIGPFAKAFGFGIDAGLQYRVKQWRFGFMARDVTGTFDAWNFNFTDAEKQILLQTNNQLPQNTLEITTPTLILAGAYEFKIKNKFFILPEADFSFTTDGKENVLLPGNPVSMDLNAGLELKYIAAKDIDVCLRAGVGSLQRSTNELGNNQVTVSPNVGVGVHIKIISLDYALTNLTTVGGAGVGLYSNVISLRLDITKRQQQKE